MINTVLAIRKVRLSVWNAPISRMTYPDTMSAAAHGSNIVVLQDL